MKRLLIGKDLAYAKTSAGAVNTALTPNLLANGSIGIYGFDPATNKSVLITASTTATGMVAAANFKGSQIQIFQGSTKEPIQIGPLDVEGFSKATFSAYVAAAYETLYVGYNETAGDLVLTIDALSILNEANIKIVERKRGNNDRWYFNYTVPVVVGATKLQVATDLVAKINASTSDYDLFTASVVNSGAAYGVKLVSKNIGRNFEVVAKEVISNSTITLSQGSLGSGTPTKLKDYELNSQIRRGLIVKDIFDKKFTSDVDDTKTYDIYELTVLNKTVDSFLGANPGMSEMTKSLVAFEVQADVVGTNQQSDWDAIAAALIAL